MPGEQAEYDLIRVLDTQADSKQDTFFISPKEIGRDGSGVQAVTFGQAGEPDSPVTGAVAVFLDSSGTLKQKLPDGTVTPLAGVGGSAEAVHTRDVPAGESLTVDSDESLTLTGPVDIDGTLTVDGGVSVL